MAQKSPSRSRRGFPPAVFTDHRLLILLRGFEMSGEQALARFGMVVIEKVCLSKPIPCHAVTVAGSQAYADCLRPGCALAPPPCGPPRSAECSTDESLYIAYFRSYEYGTLVSRDFYVAWPLHCCRRNVRPIAAGRFVPSQSAAIRVTFPFPAFLPPLLLQNARCLCGRTGPRQVPLQAVSSACDRAPGDLSQPSINTRKLP